MHMQVAAPTATATPLVCSRLSIKVNLSRPIPSTPLETLNFTFAYLSASSCRFTLYLCPGRNFPVLTSGCNVGKPASVLNIYLGRIYLYT